MAKCRYERWNARVDTMECLPWYNCRELATAMKTIRRINYTNAKERKQALEMLNKIQDNAPFSRAQRFDNGFYVLEGSGFLGKKLQKLRCLLEITDAKLKSGGFQAAHDVVSAYRRNCTHILGELAKGDEIYDRKRFEKQFNVVWTTRRLNRIDSNHDEPMDESTNEKDGKFD